MSLTKFIISSASIIIIHFGVRLHLIISSILFFFLLLIKRWSLLDGFRHISLNNLRQRNFFLDWLRKRCFSDNHKLRCFFFDWFRHRLFLEWFRQRCFVDVHKFRGFLFDRLKFNLLFLSPLLFEKLLEPLVLFHSLYHFVTYLILSEPLFFSLLLI